MRGLVPRYHLEIPRDLNHALDLLSDLPVPCRPFAGGTDLMVLLEAGVLQHIRYVDLSRLKELQGITIHAEHINLGALTTYSQILKNEILNQEFPLLCSAAKDTGAVAIQNRGTLGGNLANASPAADTPPTLLVYHAELELISKMGSRWISYDQFHLGYKKTALKPGELISQIKISRKTKWTHQWYRKVGTRKAQAISKICFAGASQLSRGKIEQIHLALGSVAPTPIRLFQTEAVLQGKTVTSELIDQASLQLAQEIHPIDDIRSTSEYRKQVACNLLKEFLSKR